MGGGGGRPYSPLARETVLLNSLRRLLLKLPQLEAVLAKWCGGYGLPGVGGVGSLLRQRGPGKPHAGGDEDNQCLPRFSAQFRQVTYARSLTVLLWRGVFRYCVPSSDLLLWGQSLVLVLVGSPV